MLQSIQDAETQAAKALQMRMEEVENEDLREMFERRLEAGEHVLEDVRNSLEKLDGGSRRVQNKAARGLKDRT